MSESAFPFKFNYGNDRMECDYGLTKRELFAAMAMQSWITSLTARRGEPAYNDGEVHHYAARLAADSANELIAALEAK